jgi:hypothetical protein
MFVRFQTRPNGMIVAMLMHSEWTPAGPRQRTVAYLGAVALASADAKRLHRFWRDVRARLRAAGITGKDARAVLDRLGTRVPGLSRSTPPFSDLDPKPGLS